MLLEQLGYQIERVDVPIADALRDNFEHRLALASVGFFHIHLVIFMTSISTVPDLSGSKMPNEF